MSCSVCGAPRGDQRYCWNCGAEMPKISLEDLLKFEIRRDKKQKKYGRAVTVSGVLKQGDN